MPKPVLSPWKRHVADWSNCTRCPLHLTRRQVVLAKGKIPAQVLFIGEAPGASEDVIGRPFVGPAGNLLERMVADAVLEAGYTPTMVYGNLVGCIPKSPETGRKRGEPVKAEIDACYPRVEELIDLVKPDTIIAVGSLSAKVAKAKEWGRSWDVVEIVHPSFILQNQGQTGILAQQVIVRLSEAFYRLREAQGD